MPLSQKAPSSSGNLLGSPNWDAVTANLDFFYLAQAPCIEVLVCRLAFKAKKSAQRRLLPLCKKTGARVRGRGVGKSSTREADVAAERNQVCRVHPARNRATVRVFRHVPPGSTWWGFVPGPGRLRDSSRRASSRRTVVVYNRSEKSLYFLLPHNLLEA